MSYSTTVSCTCERCGTIFNGTIWQSVNADVDPELRDKLIHWELMKFTCSGCGLEEHVAYDLLYHDMKREFMIWLVHSDSAREKIFAEPLEEEFQMMEGYKFRLVGTYYQMLEKIYIFESALDDIVIEFVKNIIVENAKPGDKQLQTEDIYYSHLKDNHDLVFVILQKDQESQTISLRKKAYLDKLDNLNMYLDEMKTKDSSWMIVNHIFIKSLEDAWQGPKLFPRSKRPSLMEKLRREW